MGPNHSCSFCWCWCFILLNDINDMSSLFGMSESGCQTIPGCVSKMLWTFAKPAGTARTSFVTAALISTGRRPIVYQPCPKHCWTTRRLFWQPDCRWKRLWSCTVANMLVVDKGRRSHMDAEIQRHSELDIAFALRCALLWGATHRCRPFDYYSHNCSNVESTRKYCMVERNVSLCRP